MQLDNYFKMSNITSDLSVIRVEPIKDLAKRLKPYGDKKNFSPGTILFQQLEEIRSIFVIESGLVELAFISKMGDKKVIAYCYKGVIIGEMGLYQNYINSSEATVIEKSILNVIPINKGREELFKDPEISSLLYQSLCSKLQLITNQLGIMALESIISRIAYILLDFNADEINLTQEKLADSVGCSRMTITRHLGTLEKLGAIKNERGKIRILEKATLRKLI